EKLFQSFSQVDSSTTRKYGGTGLGLVICEKLIKLMNGSIEVESIEGKGTTFAFKITVGTSLQPSLTYINSNQKNLEGKKILVVDDNSTNREILRAQLIQWKFIPELSSSGKDALKKLKGNTHFDMVLTDMHMPEMDGLELSTIIKAKYPDLPIILLSSVGDDSHVKQKEIFSSVLTKPVRQNTLHKHIVHEFRTLGKESGLSKKNVTQDFALSLSEDYPLKILVAEDNLVNQRLALLILKKMGYEADIASNGKEAVAAALTKNYDFILMDVQMPVMDGLEATREIRKSNIKQQPAIIAVTANAMQGDREICLDAGMDDYISKPIKLEEIVSVLTKWHTKIKIRSKP